VGTYISGTISDKIGRRNTLLLVAMVSPLLLWIFVMLDGQFVFPMLVIVGLFLLASTPVILAIIHELETEHLPFVNGIYMTGNFLISALATLIIGYGFDNIGYEISFKFAAILAVVTIPIVYLIPKNIIRT
jgi:FSR family fosmidomycin resistance protein-like MFS transporter